MPIDYKTFSGVSGKLLEIRSNECFKEVSSREWEQISDDSIYRNIDNIESNRQKKYSDISVMISRYYRDNFRHTLIVFQGKLRNSRRTVCRNLMTVFN